MPDDKSEFEVLAKRYLDLWQDQVNALAADPVMADAVAKGISALSGGLASMTGNAGTQQPGGMDAPAATGAAPPSASSVVSSDVVAVLVGRVAELERRVAELEKLGGQGRIRSRAAGPGKASGRVKS